MNRTSVAVALGFMTALAAAPVVADETIDCARTIDCFYASNQSHPVCQASTVTASAPIPRTDPGYLAVENGEESVDCFYEANRSNALCTVAPERVVLHSVAP
jgi:hypothetical protein